MKDEVQRVFRIKVVYCHDIIPQRVNRDSKLTSSSLIDKCLSTGQAVGPESLK